MQYGHNPILNVMRFVVEISEEDIANTPKAMSKLYILNNTKGNLPVSSALFAVAQIAHLIEKNQSWRKGFESEVTKE